MKRNEILFLEYAHKLKKSIVPIIQANGQFADLPSARIGYSTDQEKIKSIILHDKNCFIGRFGSIELNALCNYLQINNLLEGVKFSRFNYVMDKCWPVWWSCGAKNGMQNNAGFFTASDDLLNRWGSVCMNDCLELDILLSWQKNEQYVKPFLKNLKDEIDNYQVYYPIAHENPWTEILAGKKILVVSPFSESIEYQYKNNRKKLFLNEKVLPQFELQTVKAFNFLRGVTDGKIDTWFDALEIMKTQIAKLDFDIALLGCGAYAFNLGAFVKRIGKTAITMCGGLPALFGIYGERNESWLRESGILNEYWIRPSEQERPFGYDKVENGAYW